MKKWQRLKRAVKHQPTPVSETPLFVPKVEGTGRSVIYFYRYEQGGENDEAFVSADTAHVRNHMCATILAQSDNDMTTVMSCQLTIKTTAYPPDSADLFGKAMVEATLCDNEGFPIYNQEVRMTATTGVFSCLPPEVLTDATMKDPVLYCFTTGQDGTIQAYIVNIPFNT
jgi:hypothetical protein